jgi:hypothetical protein
VAEAPRSLLLRASSGCSCSRARRHELRATATAPISYPTAGSAHHRPATALAGRPTSSAAHVDGLSASRKPGTGDTPGVSVVGCAFYYAGDFMAGGDVELAEDGSQVGLDRLDA